MHVMKFTPERRIVKREGKSTRRGGGGGEGEGEGGAIGCFLQFLVDVCATILQTLTHLQTKICKFSYQFSDLTSRIHTRFQTFRPKRLLNDIPFGAAHSSSEEGEQLSFEKEMGPLQLTVTWCKKHLAGE